MKRVTIAFTLCWVSTLLTGCGKFVSTPATTKVQPVTSSARVEAKSESPDASRIPAEDPPLPRTNGTSTNENRDFPSPPKPNDSSRLPAEDPPMPGKDAEPLPELPKADPKSVIKELLPDKSLFLETKPDGSKRLLLVTEVCLREGVLEVLLCKKNTKEHEAIIRTDVDARYIHAALVAIGIKPGSPVQFIDPKSGEPDYKPASGDKIRVLVHYKKGGKLHTHPAQEWIRDLKTKQPMTHPWVFAGSRFFKNPEKPDDPPYYCANNGEIIAISNFVDSMLDLPVEISRDNAALNFDATSDKIPPLLSKVWVIFEAETKDSPKK